MAIIKLLGLFPRDGFQPTAIDRFNRDVLAMHENARDIVIAHYCITDREDTDFWKYVKYMSIPDSLRERIELYRETGQCYV